MSAHVQSTPPRSDARALRSAAPPPHLSLRAAPSARFPTRKRLGKNLVPHSRRPNGGWSLARAWGSQLPRDENIAHGLRFFCSTARLLCIGQLTTGRPAASSCCCVSEQGQMPGRLCARTPRRSRRRTPSQGRSDCAVVDPCTPRAPSRLPPPSRPRLPRQMPRTGALHSPGTRLRLPCPSSLLTPTARARSSPHAPLGSPPLHSSATHRSTGPVCGARRRAPGSSSTGAPTPPQATRCAPRARDRSHLGGAHRVLHRCPAQWDIHVSQPRARAAASSRRRRRGRAASAGPTPQGWGRPLARRRARRVACVDPCHNEDSARGATSVRPRAEGSRLITRAAPGLRPASAQHFDTALHWASRGGHVDCVRLLVWAGADFHCRDEARPPAAAAQRHTLHPTGAAGSYGLLLRLWWERQLSRDDACCILARSSPSRRGLSSAHFSPAVGVDSAPLRRAARPPRHRGGSRGEGGGDRRAD